MATLWVIGTIAPWGNARGAFRYLCTTPAQPRRAIAFLFNLPYLEPMKMRTFTICLDEETLSRLSAASAACGVPRGHVAREVLRASFGVVDPISRVFAPPRPSADAPWLNRNGNGAGDAA
jgi:hypothetical protein